MDPALFFVPLAALTALILANLVSRVLVIPLVVFEIALGMPIGPAGLGWIQDGRTLEGFSHLGLAMLFFMAGNEIDLRALRGASGRRSLWGWAATAVLAFAAATVLGDSVQSVASIAITLTGTALGTITPILRDAGLTSGRIGAAVTASGAVGEFLPLLAMTIFLSGRSPVAGIITLVIFGSVVALAAFGSSRTQPPWVQRLLTQTLHTSSQFAVRTVVFLLAGLVTLALGLGIDFLLGAFTAGLLARVVLKNSSEDERELIDSKLEGIFFGFFVPILFVTTGINFPLKTLFADRSALVLVPVFTLVILLMRGVPGYFAPEGGTSRSGRVTAALFTATTLPLVVAVTTIGVDAKVLDSGLAAAMTAGAMHTVLLYPMSAVATAKIGNAGRPQATP